MKTSPAQAADRPYLLIGGGGHTLVLLDVLQSLGARVEGILSADTARHGTQILGVSVLGGDAAISYDPSAVWIVNGVGNRARIGDSGLEVREALVQRVKAQGFSFAPLISPQALISPSAMLEEGVQVLHRVVVQPLAHIGAHCILNTGAIIEHECRIGAFSHVAPGAVLCGNVQVGSKVHIGANATVLQGVHIGDGAVIGAGIRVTRDVAAGETLAR